MASPLKDTFVRACTAEGTAIVACGDRANVSRTRAKVSSCRASLERCTSETHAQSSHSVRDEPDEVLLAGGLVEALLAWPSVLGLAQPAESLRRRQLQPRPKKASDAVKLVREHCDRAGRTEPVESAWSEVEGRGSVG